MKRQIPKILSVMLIAASITGLSACSINDTNTNSGASEPAPVSVTMQLNSTAAGKRKAGQNFRPTLASQHITLTEVKILIKDLKVVTTGSDSLSLHMEPKVYSIPLDNSPVELTTKLFPADMYNGFGVNIDTLNNSPISDPDFSSNGVHYSIVIKGIHEGNDFVFKSSTHFEAGMEFGSPLEITGRNSAAVIHIMLDVNSWFTNEGTDLDPSDPSAKTTIEQNIAASFHAVYSYDQPQKEL